MRGGGTSADGAWATCWPHIAMKRIKEWKGMIKPGVDVEGQLRIVHLCDTLPMFKAALGLLLAHWRETGMGELAKRMEESYNVAPWDSWWLCATGVAGATACNNALESFHHWLKQQAWPKLRVPFDTALFVCLPEMLVALREKNMLPIHRVVHVDGTHAAYRVYAHRRP
jgi:hypothetical protein